MYCSRRQHLYLSLNRAVQIRRPTLTRTFLMEMLHNPQSTPEPYSNNALLALTESTQARHCRPCTCFNSKNVQRILNIIYITGLHRKLRSEFIKLRACSGAPGRHHLLYSPPDLVPWPGIYTLQYLVRFLVKCYYITPAIAEGRMKHERTWMYMKATVSGFIVIYIWKLYRVNETLHIPLTSFKIKVL
jgi:hypothetical protein